MFHIAFLIIGVSFGLVVIGLLGGALLGTGYVMLVMIGRMLVGIVLGITWVFDHLIAAVEGRPIEPRAP